MWTSHRMEIICLLQAITNDGRCDPATFHAIYIGTLMHMDTGLSAVLAVSLAVEGFSLLVATRSVVQGAAAAQLSFNGVRAPGHGSHFNCCHAGGWRCCDWTADCWCCSVQTGLGLVCAC